MRDPSVPTPAIVDSRLIEAPFEVSVLGEDTRRPPGNSSSIESQPVTIPPAPLPGESSGTSRADRSRERAERRAQRIAEKQAARRSRKKPHEERTHAEIVDPTPRDTTGVEPTTHSSFDELMGYTQS